jgi:hypothetical protein
MPYREGILEVDSQVIALLSWRLHHLPALVPLLVLLLVLLEMCHCLLVWNACIR